MANTTTIQLEERTKKRLERVKMFPRETYNQVIERLLEKGEEEGHLSPRTIRNIERSLADIKAGRVYSTKELKKELGIK
jgi:predicted transcriptional regulator